MTAAVSRALVSESRSEVTVGFQGGLLIHACAQQVNILSFFVTVSLGTRRDINYQE